MLVETTYYILPMREIRTDGGVVCADPCKPDQAQFWGMYKRESDGCSEWYLTIRRRRKLMRL